MNLLFARTGAADQTNLNDLKRSGSNVKTATARYSDGKAWNEVQSAQCRESLGEIEKIHAQLFSVTSKLPLALTAPCV